MKHFRIFKGKANASGRVYRYSESTGTKNKEVREQGIQTAQCPTKLVKRRVLALDRGTASNIGLKFLHILLFFPKYVRI
jgi:hypothetical protein